MTTAPESPNRLYFGDNLNILRRHAVDGSVDTSIWTRPMLQEAASAGFYTPEHYPDRHYPRLQILTVAELLNGPEAQYPRVAPPATFRQALRRRRSPGRQGSLVRPP